MRAGVCVEQPGIALKLSSALPVIDQAINTVEQYLEQGGAQHNSVLSLVLQELLRNAMIHGNQLNPEKIVGLKIAPLPDQGSLRIEVEDEGPGFDFMQVDMHLPEDPRLVKRRGLVLVNVLVKELSFQAGGRRIVAEIAGNCDGFWLPQRATSCFDEEFVITPQGLEENHAVSGDNAMTETLTASTERQSKVCTAEAGLFLTFQLGEEIYGLEILSVQEIIGMMKVTAVPRTPEYIRGVINLRGKVTPILELRKRFSLEATEDTERTCIVVARIRGLDGEITMGLIVDEVSEVQEITEDQLAPAPCFSSAGETALFTGMAKLEKQVVMLLNIDAIVSPAELAALHTEIDSE